MVFSLGYCIISIALHDKYIKLETVDAGVLQEMNIFLNSVLLSREFGSLVLSAKSKLQGQSLSVTQQMSLSVGTNCVRIEVK